jgi:hypothetical protein
MALTLASSGCSDVTGPGEPELTVTPSSLLLQPGGKVHLSASLQGGGGQSASAGTVTWVSSDPSIVSVDADGNVTALTVGLADITVSNGTAQRLVRAGVFNASDGDFVEFPSEEIAFVVGPQLTSHSRLNPWPWFDENAVTNGLRHGEEFFDNPADRMYYDQVRVQYINYFRTGDERFLNHARDIADHWYGYVEPQGGNVAPRSVALSGLILRALDGRPEMWDWILSWTDRHLKNWLETHIAKETLHYGLRDGGYALYYGALIAATHPDPAVREQYKQRVLTVSRDYYARLQYDNGGWYWSDSAAEIRIAKPDGSYYLHSQPFMVGLMLEGLVATHQLTGDPVVAEAIQKGAEWLYRYGYRADEPSPIAGLDWRGGWYFVFEPGTTLPSTANPEVGSDPRYGADGRTVVQGTTTLRGGTDKNSIRDVRQHNGTQLHVFGYAYKISGDARFLDWGDDMFSASFGNGRGPGADASYNLADYIAKSYNQSYRSSGTYLVRRLGK